MTNQAEAMRLFDEANRLWFEQGRTNKALSLYREAVKQDPTDPVILYQIANVLWAFERFNEAKEMFLIAQQYQDRLSTHGKKIFAEQKQRVMETTSFRFLLPVPATEFDFEKLDAMGLTHRQWLKVAFAAEERRIFGLAAYALERGMPFTDPDTERDRRKLEEEIGWAMSDLELMRPETQK